MLLTGFTNALRMDNIRYTKNKGFISAPSTLKIHYHPPELHEVLSNEKIDIWCVGILVFLAITGEYPFELDDVYDN